MSGKAATRRRTPRHGPAKVIRMPTPTVVRRRRAIKAGMGVLALSLVAAVAARIYLTRTAPPSPEQLAGLTEQESAILNAVNAERARAGRRPMRFSPRLAVVARGHSYDMAIRHYLAHRSPEGAGPAERVRGVGISYAAVAENIYMDDFADLTGLAERALQTWLASPEHRANLLSERFTQSGVGIARSADGRTYVTQDFVH
jgi:uncharacterized protein YkwD